MQPNNEKSMSMSGSVPGEENASYLTLKKTKPRFDAVDHVKDSETPNKKPTESKYVTLKEVETFFPIVYGHFAIGGALTIMYSPYTEQSLAMVVYLLLSFLLMGLNSCRFVKSTRFVWGIMCTLNCFLLVSGLLEVGQANYNHVRKECFAVNYKPLY